MQRAFLAILIVLLPVLACQSLYRQNTKTLRLKGSDTMRPLAGRWAEAYMQQHPNTAVYVEGGGTATGARALAAGRADFALASRPLRSEELEQLAQNYNTVGVSILVAKDALSIYMHPDNPVTRLSTEQIHDIFSGAITNWQAVGGRNARIQAVTRTPNSGTFLYFKEHVLENQSYRPDRLTVPTLKRMLETVSQNPDAIGYGGILNQPGIRLCTVDGIEPTVENVANDTYPITRYLYLYAVNTPRGAAKQFVDWVLSPDGQKIVRQSGFFPIWSEN